MSFGEKQGAAADKDGFKIPLPQKKRVVKAQQKEIILFEADPEPIDNDRTDSENSDLPVMQPRQDNEIEVSKRTIYDDVLRDMTALVKERGEGLQKIEQFCEDYENPSIIMKALRQQRDFFTNEATEFFKSMMDQIS